MTVNITVCKTASDSYRSNGSQGSDGARKTVQNFTQTFLVKAVKNKRGDPYDGPAEDISPAAIACNSEFPQVNRTAFFDAASGVIHPYAICTSKDIKRRSDNPYMFDVTCNYATQAGDTEDCAIMAKYVSAPTDLPVQVTASVQGRDEVIYADFGTSKEQCWQFEEVGEEYPVPVVTQNPFLTLSIQQYELYLSYSDMMDRSFVVNDSVWQGHGAGKWRIVCKAASEVEVKTMFGKAVWAKVTYEAVLGNYGYYNSTGTRTDIGWKQAIPMIASKYVDANGEVVPFTWAGTSVRRVGNIDSNGNIYNGGTGRPLYKTHERYRSKNFTTFMQPF